MNSHISRKSEEETEVKCITTMFFFSSCCRLESDCARRCLCGVHETDSSISTLHPPWRCSSKPESGCGGNQICCAFSLNEPHVSASVSCSCRLEN